MELIFEPYKMIDMQTYMQHRFSQLGNFSPHTQTLCHHTLVVQIDGASLMYSKGYQYQLWRDGKELTETFLLDSDETIRLSTSFDSEEDIQEFLFSIFSLFRVVYVGETPHPLRCNDYFYMEIRKKITETPDFSLAGEIRLTHLPTNTAFLIYTIDYKHYFVQLRNLKTPLSETLTRRIEAVFKSFQLSLLFKP